MLCLDPSAQERRQYTCYCHFNCHKYACLSQSTFDPYKLSCLQSVEETNKFLPNSCSSYKASCLDISLFNNISAVIVFVLITSICVGAVQN